MMENGTSLETLGIPCIDFGKLASKHIHDDSDDEEWKRVGKEIAHSFEDIGFAYIKNHGIPQEVIDGAHRVGAKFFELPDDVRTKYSKDKSTSHGFVEMNRELLHKNGNLKEFRESYDVTNLKGTFAPEVEGFQSNVQKLVESGTNMSQKLLRCLEKGLDLPSGTLLTKHIRPFQNGNGTLLRILHYPPIPPEIKEGSIRCGAHSDYGTFTLLFQDNMGGLEVKNRNNKWIKADPIPGTVLVNVGDLLQKWTAGKFIATQHQVLVPEDEVKQRCVRRSIVLFFHPDDEVVVKPFDGSSTYAPITAKEHLLLRYNETYKF